MPIIQKKKPKKRNREFRSYYYLSTKNCLTFPDMLSGYLKFLPFSRITTSSKPLSQLSYYHRHRKSQRAEKKRKMCNAFIHIHRVTIFVYPLKKKISRKISPHPSFYKCIVLHLTTVTYRICFKNYFSCNSRW